MGGGILLTSCGGDEGVKEIAVSGVSVSPTTLSLGEGETARLSASVSPSDASEKTVSWTSSDAKVASVGPGGEVTGVKAGSATITVTSKDGGKKATCSVSVRTNVVPVTGVSLDETALTMKEGERKSLTARVQPENATDKSVSWKSSDEGVASVDGSGEVTAIKAGSATITVTTTDGGKKAECAVIINIEVVKVESVSLDKTALDIKVGETKALTARVQPENATDRGVIWSSSDETVASVSDKGEVTGVKAGKATVTVTSKDGGKKAECAVSVTNVSLEGIALDRDKSTMKIGDVMTLVVSYTPSNATEKGVSWTSGKSEVASVDQSGKVTAVSEGVSQIVATSKDGGYKAICNVTVEGISVTGIMHVDGIYYQPVSVGSREVEVTNKKGGYLTGENENDYSGSVKVPSSFEYKGVTYNVKRVGSFAFYGSHSLTTVTLSEGLESIKPKAFQNCENLETLSIPSSLILVDESNPLFRGCKKLNISVAAGGVFKMTDGMLCGNYWSHNRLVWLQENRTGEVSVPEGITCINSDATTSSPMTKITIPATVTYIQGRNFEDCANLKEVVLCWSEAQLGKLIYEPNVAGAYFTGAVYTDITVRVPKGTKAAYEAHKLWGMGFKITEYEVPVTGVTLDRATLEMTEGESVSLKATVSPESASDKTVTWSSSNGSVASVDASGNVKAVKAGSATITVTSKDGGKKATCAVSVKEKKVAVESVTLDRATLEMTEGESVSLKATVSPESASDKTVTWSSSNGSVASVDASGNVKAVKAGSATITVTSKDGGKKATCSVTVNPAEEVLFADAKFKEALISKEVDTNGDGMISESEAAAVSSITVNTYTSSITSLGGIEKFTNLTSLDCQGIGSDKLGGLTTIDLSKNTKLSSLICSNNKLLSIDVSKNTALTYLKCYINQLTVLDVSKNTALTELYCGSNQLTVLDVGKNTALTKLYCGSNQLTVLDVSKNTALTELLCYSNQLTVLDVSKNTALTYLSCESNQLTVLDVSKNTALTKLWCNDNKLTSLDVSKNTALTSLCCSYMSTLITLYMASGQVIDYINGTGDKARNNNYIPETTTITVK